MRGLELGFSAQPTIWSGLVKAVLSFVKPDSFPYSLQFTWADVGVSALSKEDLACASRAWQVEEHSFHSLRVCSTPTNPT